MLSKCILNIWTLQVSVVVCPIQFYLTQKLSSKVLYPKRKKAKMWTRCWSPLRYNTTSN